jgi:hypothetical protein
MLELFFITGVGQIILPLALAFRLWRAACRNRLEWFLHTLPVPAYLGLIAVAGVWLLVPRSLLYGFALLSLAAAVVSWRRCSRPCPPAAGRSRHRRATVLNLVMTAFCTGMLGWALSGYRLPEKPAIDLASPLKNGNFFVINGGYSILINPHMKTIHRESLSAYRAQSYALDIVQTDWLGRRAAGWRPADPARYHIFDEPVFAPCTGAVTRIEDRLPDQAPSDGDPRHPAGNFVLLECTDAFVLLAHLKHASITVRPGDQVQTGDPVGRVGNSGLSLEPHLHLHAQGRPQAENFLSSEPLPFQVEGRTLVRNDRFFPR